MKKIIFDTNVIFDAIGKREPFVVASTNAIATVEREDVVGAMTANTITDLYFLLGRRKMAPDDIKDALVSLMDALEVLDTTKELCMRAFRSPVADFEDAVLVESAKHWSADYIVTRNIHDFAASPIKAIAPDELLSQFGT